MEYKPSLGERNNNPLNVRYSVDNDWVGQTGAESGFSKFESAGHGLRAASKTLATYAEKHGVGTVRDAISRFAPPEDQNDTEAYIAFVSSKTGIDPNAPIDLTDPALNARIVSAMAKMESGMDFSPDDVMGLVSQADQAFPPNASSDPGTGTGMSIGASILARRAERERADQTVSTGIGASILARRARRAEAPDEEAALTGIGASILARREANRTGVIDGDTFTTEGGVSNRADGIQAPEMGFHGKQYEAAGYATKRRYEELLATGEYSAEHVGELDHFGRRLTKMVNPDGQSIEGQLVREGYALPFMADGDMEIRQAHEDSLAAQARGEVLPGVEAKRLEYQASHAVEWDPRGFAARALARGTDNMQATFGAAVQAAGEVVGSEGLIGYGEEVKNRNLEEASRSPADIASFRDVDGVLDGLKFVAESALEQIPQLAVDLGVGAAAAIAAPVTGGGSLAVAGTALVARQSLMTAGRKFMLGSTRKTAFNRGVLATMYPQMVGESFMSLEEGDVEGRAAAVTALGTGVINTALEKIGLDAILGSMKVGAPGAVSRVRDIVTETVKAAGLAVPAEGFTEVAQNIVNDMATMAHNPDYEIDTEAYLEAFFRGAAAGGGLASTGRAATATGEYFDSRRGERALDTSTAETELGQEGGELAGGEQTAEGQPITSREPLNQLQEQFDDFVNAPEASLRQGFFLSASNADSFEEFANKAPEGVSFVETDEGWLFSRDQAVLDEYRAADAEGRDAIRARSLGYSQPKGSLKNPDSAVVTQTRNAEGTVTFEEASDAELAPEVKAKQERAAGPGATVVQVTPQEAMQEREATQSAPEAENGTLSAPEAENGTLSAPEAENGTLSAPEAENGTLSAAMGPPERASLFERGTKILRRVADLAEDLRKGRLTMADVEEALVGMGRDPSTMVSADRPKIDRFAVARNLEGVRVHGGFTGPNGTVLSPHKLAQSAITDAELIAAAREAGVDAPLLTELDRRYAAKEIYDRATTGDFAESNLAKLAEVGLVFTSGTKEGQVLSEALLRNPDLPESMIRAGLSAVGQGKTAENPVVLKSESRKLSGLLARLSQVSRQDRSAEKSVATTAEEEARTKARRDQRRAAAVKKANAAREERGERVSGDPADKTRSTAPDFSEVDRDLAVTTLTSRITEGDYPTEVGEQLVTMGVATRPAAGGLEVKAKPALSRIPVDTLRAATKALGPSRGATGQVKAPVVVVQQDEVQQARIKRLQETRAERKRKGREATKKLTHSKATDKERLSVARSIAHKMFPLNRYDDSPGAEGGATEAGFGDTSLREALKLPFAPAAMRALTFVPSRPDLSETALGKEREAWRRGRRSTITDDEIKDAAKALGVKYSNVNFDRKGTLVTLQKAVKRELLTGEKSGVAMVLPEGMTEETALAVAVLARAAALDVKVIQQVAKRTGIDSVRAVSEVRSQREEEVLELFEDELLILEGTPAMAAREKEIKKQFRAMERFYEKSDFASIKNETSAHLKVMLGLDVGETVTSQTLYDALYDVGGIMLGVEGYHFSVNEKELEQSPGVFAEYLSQRRLESRLRGLVLGLVEGTMAEPKGTYAQFVSWENKTAPEGRRPRHYAAQLFGIATLEDRKKALAHVPAELRGLTLDHLEQAVERRKQAIGEPISDEGDALSPITRRKDFRLYQALATFRTTFYKGKNLYRADGGGGTSAIRGRPEARIVGIGVDAIGLSEIGRAHLPEGRMGNFYQQAFEGFHVGLDRLQEVAGTDALRLDGEIGENIPGDLIIAEHPDTGKPITYKEASEKMDQPEGELRTGDTYKFEELDERVQNLEQQMVDRWNELDGLNLDPETAEMLDDWFWSTQTFEGQLENDRFVPVTGLAAGEVLPKAIIDKQRAVWDIATKLVRRGEVMPGDNDHMYTRYFEETGKRRQDDIAAYNKWAAGTFEAWVADNQNMTGDGESALLSIAAIWREIHKKRMVESKRDLDRLARIKDNYHEVKQAARDNIPEAYALNTELFQWRSRRSQAGPDFFKTMGRTDGETDINADSGSEMDIIVEAAQEKEDNRIREEEEVTGELSFADNGYLDEDGNYDEEAAVDAMLSDPEASAMLNELAAKLGSLEEAASVMHALNQGETDDSGEGIFGSRLSKRGGKEAYDTSKWTLREVLLDLIDRTTNAKVKASYEVELGLIEAKMQKDAAVLAATPPEYLPRPDPREDNRPLRDESRRKGAVAPKFIGAAGGPGRRFRVASKDGKFNRAATRLIKAAQETLGLRIPLVIMTRANLRHAPIDRTAKAHLLRNLRNRDPRAAAYVGAGEYGVIVMPDVGGSLQEQLVTFAHELGHAYMASHLKTVSSETHQQLQGMYEAATNKKYTDEGGVEAFDEWVADQFAHWALGERNLFGTKDAAAMKEASKILESIAAIWDMLTQLLATVLGNKYYQPFGDYLRAVQGSIEKSKTKSEAMGTKAGRTRVMNLDRVPVQKKMAGALRKMWQNKAVGNVYRSLRGQIDELSPMLADMLYQRSNTVSRAGTRSWEQRVKFRTNTWQGLATRELSQFSKPQLQAGLVALRAGEMGNPAARALRLVFDTIEADIRKAIPGASREGFVAEVFDHKAIGDRRSEFDQLMEKHFPDLTRIERQALGESILYSDGINDLTMSPGKPVSQHAHVNKLLSNKNFYRAVAEGGFLMNEPLAVVNHYSTTAAKRTAWEELFGGYVPKREGYSLRGMRLTVLRGAGIEIPEGTKIAELQRMTTAAGLEKDGTFYSPNANLHVELDKIAAEHGPGAAKRAQDLVRNGMGLDGHSMPEGARAAQNWLVTWLNYVLLSFSGLMSTPEITGGVIRGAGRVSAGDVFAVLRDFKDLKTAATDLGIIMSDMTEIAMLESMGQDYRSPIHHKLNYMLFKYNGQQTVMRTARVMAYGLGKRYIFNAAVDAKNGDKRALAELAQLHLTPEDVVAWHARGQTGHIGVEQALNQFVHESVIEPSRFESTTWGNNPYMKLAWHLKQFFYSYMEVILMGVWRNMGGRWNSARDEGVGVISAGAYAAVPGLIAAAMIAPLVMAAQELREWITDADRTENLDGLQYSWFMFSRAGGLGPLEILASMKQAAEWGNSPIAAMTTITSKGEQFLSGDKPLSERLLGVTPILAQNRELWRALVD